VHEGTDISANLTVGDSEEGADDFVCGFERAEEAERFYNELEERYGRSGWNWRETRHGSYRSVVIDRERRALSFWVSSFAGV